MSYPTKRWHEHRQHDGGVYATVFTGFYTGNEEYWNHTSPCWKCGNYTALDMHRATATSFEPVTNESMHYSTELFTEVIVNLIHGHQYTVDHPQPLFIYAPYEAVHGASSCFVQGKAPDCNQPDGDELQAPKHYVDAQSHIVDGDRRTFAGMLGALVCCFINQPRAPAPWPHGPLAPCPCVVACGMVYRRHYPGLMHAFI